MEFEVIIGLEVHVQMRTKTKLFCSCDNAGEEKPANTCVCPVCMGHPGTLPVLNRQAVEWGIMTSLALHCQVDPYSKFDRKHYFYPDLSKAYQISQYDMPVGKNGYLLIADPVTGEERKIRINRLHIEEDAAKNHHTADGKHTLVDYNRGGTPLMEIVSEPEMRTPAEAKEYLKAMRQIVRYLGVSHADMEKGHLRCDANVSLRPAGDTKLYAKTEIKNINSFSSVERALEYEIKRQREMWLEGHPPAESTTRGWNDDAGVTEEQRSKEAAHDYRYFPDPDLPPLHFTNGENEHCDPAAAAFDVACIRRAMPELPHDKRRRFAAEFGMSAADADALTDDRAIADWTEQVISELRAWVAESGGDWESGAAQLTKLTANWMINTFIPRLQQEALAPADTKVTQENFAELLSLIHAGKINNPTAQTIFAAMMDTGVDPSDYMREHGLEQINDASELEKLVDEAIAANPKSVADYKGGKDKALQALIGPIMGKTKGKANPAALMDLIKKKIG